MLDYILPAVYQETLSTLLADTPTSSFSAVRRVIKEDLGAYPEEIFEAFDAKPIASASLAQVHVAWRGGQKFAVKVQHEGLLEESKWDMLVITYIVELLSRLFEGFDYNWLSREMNANLPLELNFKIEAENLVRCTKALAKLIASGDLVVPTSMNEMSSSRVLTMTFEEGSHISNVNYMRNLGINTADVAYIVSKAFCEQAYRHGFVHCDPHEVREGV